MKTIKNFITLKVKQKSESYNSSSYNEFYQNKSGIKHMMCMYSCCCSY